MAVFRLVPIKFCHFLDSVSDKSPNAPNTKILFPSFWSPAPSEHNLTFFTFQWVLTHPPDSMLLDAAPPSSTTQNPHFFFNLLFPAWDQTRSLVLDGGHAARLLMNTTEMSVRLENVPRLWEDNILNDDLTEFTFLPKFPFNLWRICDWGIANTRSFSGSEEIVRVFHPEPPCGSRGYRVVLVLYSNVPSGAPWTEISPVKITERSPRDPRTSPMEETRCLTDCGSRVGPPEDEHSIPGTCRVPE